MIRIQLDWAIALYISAALLLVLILWISYNYLEDNNLSQSAEELIQCEFCGHLFFNHLQADILICPLCRSYISAEGREKVTRKQARRRSNAHKETG